MIKYFNSTNYQNLDMVQMVCISFGTGGSEMNIPKMILFDYGHTLLYEPGFNKLCGTEAIMPYVTENPQGLTAKEIADFNGKIFTEYCRIAQPIGLEMHNLCCMRLSYELLGLKFSVSIEEIERVFWDNTSIGAVMPYAKEMLRYISKRGIRCGVVSNMGWSGKALQQRINRLIPENHFEFVLASSEYMIRKPNPLIFELALKKANLSAGDVWFCGDSPTADVEGAAVVGVFPVWYEDLSVENPWREVNSKEPNCEHLHIYDWRDLVEKLEVLV
jgi:putative hydrolase of the HAD superfamily